MGYAGSNRGPILSGVLVCLSVAIPWMPSVAADWEHVTTDEGVTVSRKYVDGRDLPIFRGIKTYKASIYDVLSVLDNVGLRTKWVHRCEESKLIKRLSDFSRVIYNRTDAPWPVNDRDVVVQTLAVVDTVRKTVRITFKNVPGYMPEQDGAVRISRLIGFYYLEMLGKDKTRVTYQIDTDPGGWLPNWVIRMASEKIPLNTLIQLGEQIAYVQKNTVNDDLKAQWLSRLNAETGQKL